MTASPPAASSGEPKDPSVQGSGNGPNIPDAETTTQVAIDILVQQLRRKEGNWVEWGKACQTLQKAKMSTQDIFEATGFEPIQQTQLIVASQVIDSMLAGGVSEKAKTHYQRQGSDSLYEF